MPKFETIEYIAGWEWDADGDGEPIKKLISHKQTVVVSSTKRFHNCLYLLAGLSRCAKCLIDYLGEEMNENNIVYHTAGSRDTFRAFISEITNGETTYADQSVKQAWAELAKSGLLIKQPNKATFQVHPKFFWNGSDKSRIDKLVAEISFNNKGKDNFKILPNKRLGISASISAEQRKKPSKKKKL
jgi:hypothetical protein